MTTSVSRLILHGICFELCCSQGEKEAFELFLFESTFKLCTLLEKGSQKKTY